MPLSAPESLAARRTFAPEDVFFSTTDRRGVIRQANATFLRLAALTEDEAVGSPHNVIRHPQMPGGAFRLIWDELEAGRPACAYLANEARDGLRYDVLAAVVPIDGGYLSVRLRPHLLDVEAAVMAAYDDVTRRERDLRDAGASRHSAAERGAVLLTRALARLGFASLESFARLVLPREVEALVAALPPAVAPGAEAGPLGAVLAASQEIGAATAGVVGSLEGQQEAAMRAARDHGNLTPVIGELDGVRRELAHLATLLTDGDDDGERAELVALTATLDTWCEDAVDGLESLPLERLQVATRDLSLRIAMFVLLNQMVTRFTSEVIEAGDDGVSRGAELRQLHAALEQQLDRTASAAHRVTELRQVVPELTGLAVAGLDRAAGVAQEWADRLMAAAAAGLLGEAGGEVLALATVVAVSVAENAAAVAEVVGVSDELRRGSVAFDPDALRGALGRIGAGVADLP